MKTTNHSPPASIAALSNYTSASGHNAGAAGPPTAASTTSDVGLSGVLVTFLR